MPEDSVLSGLLSRDAQRFVSIAKRMHDSKTPISLNAIADQLNMSPSTVRDTMRRVGDVVGRDVLATTAKSKNGTVITDAGLDLLDQLCRLGVSHQSADSAREISIAASSTLIVSGVLDTALQKLQQSCQASLRLRTAARLQFSEILSGLQDCSIDFAVVWGVDQRVRKLPRYIDLTTINPLVDVVVVSHDTKLIDEVNAAILSFPDESAEQMNEIRDALARYESQKYASLRDESQAAIDYLPSNDGSRRRHCIKVDTIDSAIAMVRCRAAAFTVVPAIYDNLEKAQQEGRFRFSKPVSRVPIVLLCRHGLDDGGKMTKTKIIQSLHRKEELPTWGSPKHETDTFPQSLEFYESLRWGYYIGADVPREGRPAQWCWESIQLKRVHLPDRDPRRLKGTIRNEFGVEFSVIAQFRSAWFAARVERDKGARTRGEKIVLKDAEMAAKQFLATFHYCNEEQGIVCGTWSGNSADQRPGVFATIWSKDKLDLSDLMSITRDAHLHSVMWANSGCEDKHDQTEYQSNKDLMFDVNDSGDERGFFALVR